MTQSQAEFLVEVCNNDGVEAELYEGYSGRCMYGERTWGVTVPDLAKVITALVNGIARQEISTEPTEIGRLQWDNMGRDMIVY